MLFLFTIDSEKEMIAFSLGPINVYRYGIMYLLSFVLGYIILKRGQKQGWYLNTHADLIIRNDLDGLMTAILIGVMAGGRLGHVIIYDLAYYLAHPLKILAFQEGGMSFIGGIIGVIVAVIIYLHYFSPLKGEKIQYLSLFDAFIPLVPIGIFFGRFGNFLNQELYGRVVPVDARGLPSWFVHLCQKLEIFHIYPAVDQVLRINTNFLSMFGEGMMIACILWYCFFVYVRTKRWKTGKLSWLFLILYSVVRFILEYLRQDSQAEIIAGFSKSQWFFLLFFAIAVSALLWQGNVQRMKKTP